MGYKFTGIISKVDISGELDNAAIMLALPEPHVGFIFSLTNVSDIDEKIEKLSKKISAPLLYLSYETWAGPIDWVEGTIWQEGVGIFTREGEKLEDFLDIMSNIGLELPEDGEFQPFSRGFFEESI